ncbi:hypothetical protein [Helicobacter rodentium]|uniref:hypothetical protein n=1 Tax=Helicobacter rodentium TaxID=59617 RepID=UPI00047A9976|nr:hypothetical protein [Helicobacter rodentium]
MQFLIVDCHENFLNFLAMTQGEIFCLLDYELLRLLLRSFLAMMQWLAFCHCEAVRSTTKQSIILLPQKDSIANTFICVIVDCFTSVCSNIQKDSLL